MQCKKLGEMFTGPTYKLLSSFTIILDVYMSFIPKKLYLLSTVQLSGFQRLSGFQSSPGALKSTQ